MEDSEAHFILASVVLVAPENNPQMYRREWLEHNEIFDEKMEVQQAVATPPLTAVSYDNGFTFEARDDRTEIKVEYDREDSPDAKSEKLDMLGRYVLNFADEMRYLSHDAVGLNYRIAIENPGLKNVTAGLPSGSEPQQLAFVIPSDEATAKIQLSTGTLTTSGTPVVVVNGNFHHELPGLEDEDKRYEEISGIVNKLSDAKHRLKRIINDTDL